ncbi:MAG: phosphatase PAP2 family protein [Gemmatimonadales bacterium]|nr:phosphatase PAP2 family protein [Gemmatimonadales bacterium]
MTARAPLAIATLAFHAILLPGAAVAQADLVPDAVAPANHSSPLLSRKTAAVAGFLFAATILGDRGFREEVQEHRGSSSNSMARIGNSFGEWHYVVPGLSAAFLVGQLTGSRDLKRVALHAGAAAALATGMTTTLKYTIGRGRPHIAGDPDQFRPFSGWNSFPSGHTAVAFALATSIADETDDGWSDVALYGAATLTAMARVNDDRHWTSDVLIGGLLGHLSAKWVSRQMGPVRVVPAGVAANIEF